jgi:hypothetical protein
MVFFASLIGGFRCLPCSRSSSSRLCGELNKLQHGGELKSGEASTDQMRIL